MAELTDPTTEIREKVRERYAAAAKTAAEQTSTGCSSEGSCCGSEVALTDEHGRQVFGGALYESAEADAAPEAAVAASLGCGVPTAVAELQQGETVLDLGSGARADVLISAHREGAPARGIAQWTGSIAGALTRQEFEQALADAGLADIEIRETHRVHAQAASAIIRARKPKAA